MRATAFFLLFIPALAGCGTDGGNRTESTTAKTDTGAVVVAQPAQPAPNAGKAAGATRIDEDFTGTYVDARDRNTDPNPFEGTLQICPSGAASYVLFSSQLVYRFKVRQVTTGDQQARLDFYFNGSDRGRGFMNAHIAEPAQGSLAATAELTAEYELSFDWKDPAFIASVRKASPDDPGHHLFPKAFYYAMRMENTMRGCED